MIELIIVCVTAIIIIFLITNAFIKRQQLADDLALRMHMHNNPRKTEIVLPEHDRAKISSVEAEVRQLRYELMRAAFERNNHEQSTVHNRDATRKKRVVD